MNDKFAELKKFNPKWNLTAGIMGAIAREFGRILPTCDSYKLSHIAGKMYAPDVVNFTNYLESRGGKYPWVTVSGIQMWMIEHLTERLNRRKIKNMKAFAAAHGEPFDENMFKVIMKEYDGVMPLRIYALPEGMQVRTGVPIVAVELSVDDKRIATLPSFIETSILHVWSTITVATKASRLRKIAMRNLKVTSDNPEAEVGFMVNDFGQRGVPSKEAAMVLGHGVLVSFMGSDNIMAIIGTNMAYASDMSAFSVIATEHSVTTSDGRDGEFGVYERLLDNFLEPGRIIACVSDGFQYYDAVQKFWCRPDIVKRITESGARVVIRPDTNDPVLTPVWTVMELAKHYGTTTNGKGYKVLNAVRVIQGDSMDEEVFAKIQEELIARGFCVSNVVTGIGGELLQKINRDTQKFAVKCSATKREDGRWHDVAKDPVSATYEVDPVTLEISVNVIPGSFKKSKAGRITTIREIATGRVSWCKVDEIPAGWENVMRLVYDNGVFHNLETLDVIRARNASYDDVSDELLAA